MSNNPVLDLLKPRVQLPLTHARERAEDPPAWMSDRQKRSFAAWTLRYEKAERAKQIRRYEAVREQVGEQIDAVHKRIGIARAEIEEINSAVSHGRLDPEPANKRLAVIFRTINEQRALVDALEQSQARATEVADTHPADYQMQLLDRFQAARSSLPVLTMAYLDGDEPDPFGGGQ